MGKHLTREEFMAAPAPMFWLKTEVVKSWTQVQKDLALKWLEANAKGWFYFSDVTWVFENNTDRVVFKTFLLTNAFSEDFGTITKEQS